MLAERERGIDLSPRKITMADWAFKWLECHHREGQIGERIYVRYEGILRNHVLPVIGNLLINELTTLHIAELKDSWLTGKSDTTDEPLSSATVYKHLNVLKSCLSNAVLMGLIKRNPASGVSSPSVKRKVEQRALDTDEIKILLDSASGTRHDIPIRFTLATGLRQGELLQLAWSDLEIEAGLLHCAGTKSPRSRRAIELSAGTVSLLKAHKQEQLERRMRSGPAWQENGLVFPTTKGTRWHARIFYRDYKKVISTTDLSDPGTILWHTLRHTAASQWIKQGADIFTVSRRLGHASAAFTMDVYAHLLKGQQAVAAEAMDALIKRA